MEFETEQPQSVQEPELNESLTPDTEIPKEQPQVIDLDSLEKFKFQGRELTPKELKSAYMAHADYTNKTKEIAQERKYYDNLEFDLSKVKSDPQLIDQFKQIYPKKFHYLVDKYIDRPQPAQPVQQQGQSQPPLPKEFMELKEKVEMFEKRNFDAEVAKHASDLDRLITGLSKKYPFADEEQVLSRAQSLRERGEDLDEKAWDGLYKMVNDKNEAFYKQRRDDELKKQKEANSKAKDVPMGGGTPGQAPRGFKTIREATEAALKDFA